ncbi:hypothetical protein BJ508DRAFT_325717 [Ascobolus immersus RN42]|uniref:Uncharacterized protein n=1 Tax=Ascobolus immersus RN42 TaxID=1160509 RepID=A0A3N4IDG7_ASCIM|nr:hypothetical protein BJ508DRAFT_325717 [Ascobolus immersus RN42]
MNYIRERQIQSHTSVIADYLCVVDAADNGSATKSGQGTLLRERLALGYLTFTPEDYSAFHSSIRKMLVASVHRMQSLKNTLLVNEEWALQAKIVMSDKLCAAMSVILSNLHRLPSPKVLSPEKRTTMLALFDWEPMLGLSANDKATITSILHVINKARSLHPPPVFLPTLEKAGIFKGIDLTQIELLSICSGSTRARRNRLLQLAKWEPWRGLIKIGIPDSLIHPSPKQRHLRSFIV